jgi:hypothetical protein
VLLVKSTGFASDFKQTNAVKSRFVLLTECPGGFSSAGRAPALQAGGRRFDPVNLHHQTSPNESQIGQQVMLTVMRFWFDLEDQEAVLFFNNLEEVKIDCIRQVARYARHRMA